MRTLLVDDSVAFLDAAQAFLALLPEFEVVGRATSGVEAIALAERLAPQLVLMDIMMPGRSGLDTARILSGLSNAPRIVLLSLHDTPEYQARARDSGAAGLLSKYDLADQLPSLLRQPGIPGRP